MATSLHRFAKLDGIRVVSVVLRRRELLHGTSVLMGGIAASGLAVPSRKPRSAHTGPLQEIPGHGHEAKASPHRPLELRDA